MKKFILGIGICILLLLFMIRYKQWTHLPVTVEPTIEAEFSTEAEAATEAEATTVAETSSGFNADDLSDWITYENPRFGFKLKYPSYLYVKEFGVEEVAEPGVELSRNSGLNIYVEGDYYFSIAECESFIIFGAKQVQIQDFETTSGLSGAIYDTSNDTQKRMVIRLGRLGTIGVAISGVPIDVFERNRELIETIINTISE